MQLDPRSMILIISYEYSRLEFRIWKKGGFWFNKSTFCFPVLHINNIDQNPQSELGNNSIQNQYNAYMKPDKRAKIEKYNQI